MSECEQVEEMDFSGYQKLTTLDLSECSDLIEFSSLSAATRFVMGWCAAQGLSLGGALS
jgi:hypothetical protein